jgi:cysteine desulfurase
MSEGIYLDNNATTKVSPEVVEAMLPYFSEQFGNPSSMHRFGDKVGRAIKKARGQVRTLLGAEHDSEIVFTSCGTESDSTAVLSALKAQPERKEITTTVLEHPAVLSLCQHLEKDGYGVHYLKVDKRGRLDMQEYMDLLSDKVAIDRGIGQGLRDGPRACALWGFPSLPPTARCVSRSPATTACKR